MKKYLQLLLNLPVFVPVEATKTCKNMAWLFSIVAVASVAGFVPMAGMFYIPTCILCLLYLFSCGGIKFNAKYLALYLAFGLSALMATEPLFNSRVRYLLFVGVTLLCTSCISSRTAFAFRNLVGRNLLFLLSLLTIGSFFCFFLGINFMRLYPGVSLDVTTAGIFGGLFSHSMLLGPLAALVALMFLNAYLVDNQKVYILLFFLSAAAVIMSASRGATLALAVPIVYLFLFMKDRGKSRSRLVGLLMLAAVAAIPAGEKMASGLMEKQQGNVEAGGTFNSRNSKWENRMEEFKENPVLGIGFCSVDLRNTEDYNTAGGVEPGSTHLSVLSMTGILGFIPYMLLLAGAYLCVRREASPVAKLRMSFFLAMAAHATVEGYGLYAGGFLCFMYWFVIGSCYDFKTLKARAGYYLNS